MAICQIMVRDFMHGGHEEGYGEYDLVVALDYALALVEEGHKFEPFHHYNLRAFIKWAERRRVIISTQALDKSSIIGV